MGGSGVQRPLKFAKYLKEFGWNPIILCPEPGAYQFFDDSLEKELDSLNLEIHRITAKTPFHSLGGGKKKTGLITGFTARVLRKISKSIYFPDNKKGWIKPAVNKGIEVIESGNIDLIFSSAPPFSNHLIAKELSEKSNIPFITDYRDLFSENHFESRESEKRKRKKLLYEAEWLNRSSGVTVLDEFAGNIIKKISPETSIQVIPHGYDPQDFDEKKASNLDYKEGKLNWLYSGLFYESNQPDIFLNAIERMVKKDPEFMDNIHVHFQGGLDSRIKRLIKQFGLDKIVSDYGYLPHDITTSNLMKADILWMISNFSENLKQIKTGKLFEYIGTKKPILGLVHEGESSKLLDEYKNGYHIAPKNVDVISSKIEEVYNLWRMNNFPEAANDFTEKFNRKKLTGELATFFDLVVKKNKDSKA